MRYILLFVSLFTLFSCGSQKDLSELRKQWPRWAKTKPVVSGYYTGVGSAEKTINIDRYKEIARQNALKNLANAISVDISSSSVLQKTEINQNISDYYSSRITVSSKQQLEGYELVDSYEDEQRYFVYYRLSKAKHRKLKQEKIDKAIDKSKSEWENARDHVKSGHYRSGLISMVSALDELRHHLHRPLKTTLNGQEVYLANELLNELQSLLDNIVIYPEHKKVSATLGFTIPPSQLAFHVSDHRERKLSDIPLKAEFTAQTLIFDTENTNKHGMARFSPGKITTQNPSGNFTVSLDMNKIIKTATSDLTIRKLVRRMNTPTAEVEIQIQKPSFFVTSEELNLGQPLDEAVLKPEFIARITSNGYKATPEKQNADYFVDIEASTVKGNDYGNVKSTILNFKVKLRDKTNKTLYDRTTNQIEGVQSNFEKAGRKAYQEGRKEIRRSVFDDVMYKLF
ncbi:MAG: LPP20 family lipoprotein [Bacteroidales bacterium]|nr:LPP20 family lipoprotein [Bacteroidales bacterium]MCF8334948.1 LPP20 family lipoprotein [Bacteroidales bacterium]